MAGQQAQDLSGLCGFSKLSDSPVDGADAGHIFLSTNCVLNQFLFDFPRKHGGVFFLELDNSFDYIVCGHLWLGSSDYSGPDRTSILKPVTPVRTPHDHIDILDKYQPNYKLYHTYLYIHVVVTSLYENGRIFGFKEQELLFG